MLCAGLYREFAMFALIQRCRCLLPAVIAVFGLFFGFTAAAVTPTTVVSGLRHPWAVAFLPDGGFLVSERGGTLRVVQLDGRIGPPLQGVPPVVASGQGGLLDVILDGDFVRNRRLFFCFAQAAAGGNVGIFDRGDEANPFRRSNFVVLPHCTGDGHAANRVSTYPPLAPIQISRFGAVR